MPHPPSPSPAPWGFTDGQLETLKWVAMGFMFVDHFGRLLLGYGLDSWVFASSRLAFPLFAIVLGVNLARAGDAAPRAARTARRLALWCVIAIAPSIWARGEPWLLNVLGTLALGAVLCWALASGASLALRGAAALLAVMASGWVEFNAPGVLLIPAVYLFGRTSWPQAGVLAAVMLAITGFLNAEFGGWPALLWTLAAVPLAALLRLMPLQLPRLQVAFYLVYPLHLALIGALKTWPWLWSGLGWLEKV
ncbi:hypothetical protein JI739_00670 [Ramlibacter sp. AW1]|uniref:Conjugal transfer protein TraX n=1 Tax=Ramlibacter aurantiacus TaxID=2801330 RepID=A0A936ZFB8_9BURK|nr:hypothetical protein [Ramlibacter aurantiacus]